MMVMMYKWSETKVKWFGSLAVLYDHVRALTDNESRARITCMEPFVLLFSVMLFFDRPC